MFPFSNIYDIDICSLDYSIEHVENEINDSFKLMHFFENSITAELEKIKELKKKKIEFQSNHDKLIQLMIQEELEMSRRRNCHSV